MKKIKFVLIGSGNIASTYCRVLNSTAQAELIGVVSRSGHLPEGAPTSTIIAPTLNAITSDFDAVIITTPNGIHHQGACEAARLGKHVLTEKPLDITREAMRQMIDSCHKYQVKLGVSYQQRMAADNIALHQLLHSGGLGKIYAADLAVRCWRDQAYYDSAPYRGGKALDGGGPFIQQAAHAIDLYGWFFGRPAKIVSMLDTYCHDIEGEDYGVALLKHDNGMQGTITASTISKPGFPQTLIVHCERGSLVMENNAIVRWDIDGIENPAQADDQEIPDLSSAAVKNTGGHQAVIDDFIAAVIDDREPAVTGESAAIATEIILDIYQNNLQTLCS